MYGLFSIFVDIDECVLKIDDCHDKAACTNKPGTFLCTCNKGYSGNGTNCYGENDK